jgi:serine/threonine protein kinase
LVADDGRALLCDFGRSRIINHQGFTSLFAGAARYMAPELILKGKEMPEVDDGKDNSFDPSEFLSKESDVYAFSMVGVEVRYAF